MTGTAWNTAEEKEEFTKNFLKFAENGYKEEELTPELFKFLKRIFELERVSGIDEFYETWFKDPSKFLKRIKDFNPVLDPQFSWSDVETAIKNELGRVQKALPKSNPSEVKPSG